MLPIFSRPNQSLVIPITRSEREYNGFLNCATDDHATFLTQLPCFVTQMGPFLEKTVASFRLLPPTDNYVPPYKDPWRFW